MNRKCPSCNQILQKSVHDICMFCGDEIPEELRLSDQDKAKFTKKVQEMEDGIKSVPITTFEVGQSVDGSVEL